MVEKEGQNQQLIDYSKPERVTRKIVKISLTAICDRKKSNGFKKS
jgi:hypothetical protein